MEWGLQMEGMVWRRLRDPLKQIIVPLEKPTASYLCFISL